MSYPKASEVTLTLNTSEWKAIQSLIHATAQQAQHPALVNRAKQVIREIETERWEAVGSDQDRASLTMSPSGWRGVQALLQPDDGVFKKDKAKAQKEHTVALIQNALDGARQQIIVTTDGLNQEYEIIGPIYFQTSNKGIFSSDLSKLIKQYQDEINQMRRGGLMGTPGVEWASLFMYSVGQNQFEAAFFVAVQELKKRAQILEADAIIGVRQDIDLDTTGFQFFYLQMYGTAVRLL